MNHNRCPNFYKQAISREQRCCINIIICEVCPELDIIIECIRDESKLEIHWQLVC